MTREAFESGRVSCARQDGSREFLLLLVYICADSTAGDSFLIYQEASESLINTWIDDPNITDAGFFTSSSNRWSNYDIGLNYSTTYYTTQRQFRRQPKDLRDSLQCFTTSKAYQSC